MPDLNVNWSSLTINMFSLSFIYCQTINLTEIVLVLKLTCSSAKFYINPFNISSKTTNMNLMIELERAVDLQSLYDSFSLFFSSSICTINIYNCQVTVNDRSLTSVVTSVFYKI